MKPPKSFVEKVLRTYRLIRKTKELMGEIDEYLSLKGYDVDTMRNADSFQVFMEYAEFASEEDLLKNLENDLIEYAPIK